MNYTNWILQNLLSKYYNSSGFINGVEKRRVILKPKDYKVLSEAMERASEKERFYAAIAELKGKHIIDFSWKKYEENNIVETIWLNTQEDNIKKVCGLLNIEPLRNQLEYLTEMIEEAIAQVKGDSELERFFYEQLEYLKNKRKLSRFFSDDMQENARLLQFLIAMDHNKSEQFERVLSSSLYQDSKYFECVLKKKVISVLKSMRKQETVEDISDDELLASYGITRWPETLEFCGDVELVLQSGERVDFSALQWGASINSMVVPEIAEVKIGYVSSVLFIENRANYFWAVQNKKHGELIIYHGGFYSPIRGKWFELLYKSCKKIHNIVFYHWSDIDLGGFRIFNRLQKNIIPELQPWKMNVETLIANKNNAITIDNKAYLKALEDLSLDKNYAIFHSVINEMLKEKIKLEQESELF